MSDILILKGIVSTTKLPDRIGLLMDTPELMRRIPWRRDNHRRPYEKGKSVPLTPQGYPKAPDSAGFYCNALISLPRAHRASWAAKIQPLDGQVAEFRCRLRFYCTPRASGWHLELRELIGEDVFAAPH